MPAPSVATEKKRSVAISEMELTRSTGDVHLLSLPTSRVSAYYPARMSVSHAASSYLAGQDAEDLRTRYQHAKRELLRLANVQKDLDFAKLELQRVQEEMKRLRESHRRVKLELAEMTQRADSELRLRNECESRLQADINAREAEVNFLRQQIDTLRSEQLDHFTEVSAQQEAEYTTRINEMLEEMNTLSNERDDLVHQLEDSRHLRDEAESRVQSALAELAQLRTAAEERQGKITTLTEQLAQAESRVQSVLRQAQEEHTKELESQRVLSETQREQLVAVKDRRLADLEAEVQQLQETNRSLAADVATLRVATEQASQERSQLQTSHDKTVRQLEETHRLAFNEQQLRMETAVREAKAGRFALEEECHSLRRQAATATAELAALSATLAQREQSIHGYESDHRTLQEKVEAARREAAQLQRELSLRDGSVEELRQRVQHMKEQKDALEEELSSDVCEARDRARGLEEALRESRTELTNLRTEVVDLEDAHRETVRRLREELGAARAACKEAAGQHSLGESHASASAVAAAQADEYRRKYLSEKQKADNLNVELCAVIARCHSLEQQLQRMRCMQGGGTRAGSGAHVRPSSSSPVALSASARTSSTTTATAGPPPPRVSSPNTPSRNGSVKRARTEDARVFAISGFDGNDLLLSIKQLPNVAIAECKSNMPVPSNLTHLVTNGQLTIKLLSALVRGCWVLPESYVKQSLSDRCWANESEFGFQHEEPPLLKQRVAFTEAFTACKHYVTANLLIKEGGATVVEDVEQANMVLCTNNELEATTKGMTWEMMVELIYPVRIE